MFRFIFSGKLHPAILQKAVKAASTAISEHERKLMELCTLPAAEALQHLGVTEHGLTDEQVETARQEYGRNILSHRKEAGLFLELLRRCRNPLVIQLLVICAVSLLMGDVRAATVVGVMVLLSVVLAYVQEHRSSKAVEKLKAMVQTDSLVLRDGKECDIPLADIVPGDIVILQAGALIPADLRLISAKDFFVSQSSL
ncbi:MAG: cation-transporting P-type ATPase, partial [Chthoniobacterales bacterium]